MGFLGGWWVPLTQAQLARRAAERKYAALGFADRKAIRKAPGGKAEWLRRNGGS